MKKFLAAATLSLLITCPAYAGNYSVDEDGQLNWKSTACTPPETPPALSDANSESAASDMNDRAIAYNDYVGKMQVYMNCVGKEAELDANKAGNAVIKAGQGTIDNAQKQLLKLGGKADKKAE